MNDRPLIFDRIIRSDLRPCLENIRHEEKFAQIIRNIITFDRRIHPLY